MKIKILFFASLSDFAGQKHIEIEDCNSLEQMLEFLEVKFPGLGKLNFAIAVNKIIAGKYGKLKDGDEIALLPPFSGG